ncbi:MAG: hypothetical protein GY765_32040 [bacterium]|nr:hypothetical protein [bacterium]
MFKNVFPVLLLVFILCVPCVVSAQQQPTAFVEYENNPVFGQHLGGMKAYYPSVIFLGDHYKMWVDNGLGQVFMTTSGDGIGWSDAVEATGLQTPRHPAVLYHASFGYRIYYWDGSVAALSTRTAESADGIIWSNDRPITQDPEKYLVGGAHGSYWFHHYGAAQVMYNDNAANTGDNPWDYSFVMTFDTASEARSEGIGIEHCGLAYSADGDCWMRYGDAPILVAANDGTWDDDYSFHGTIVRSGDSWRMWYVGSDYEAGGDYYAQGIGEAVSSDGLTWTTFPASTLHRDDGVAWRVKRSYTPCVLLVGGEYKMWFTGKSDSNYSIGYAAADAAIGLPPDTPRKPIGPASAKAGVLKTYKSKTVDVEGNPLHYRFDWGDGTFSAWLGPVKSGKMCKAQHAWPAGKYKVRVKAKNSKGVESDWSKKKKVRIR